MEPPRWNIVTASRYEWERRGLDFIRQGLPNHDPYRAWANFEFQTRDGAIYEVDLLVLTKQGFWLVECKAWSGRIAGDAQTWRLHREGQLTAVDNPVLLANRKAKALASLLSRQSAMAKVPLPYLEPLVFLSADDVQCELVDLARNRVLLQDRPAEGPRPARSGILAALLNRVGPGIPPEGRGVIDIRVAKALSRAMEQLGIRPAQRSRRLGDYLLQELLWDGPGYQDHLAKHTSHSEGCYRVRQYTVAQAASEAERQRRRQAAAREYRLMQTLEHPGILLVVGYIEHEQGPALVFRYPDPEAQRFDHYLASHALQLSSDQRLDLVRQIADAIRYAHTKRVIHRSLGPQSILVHDPTSANPKIRIFNWQVGFRDGSSAPGPLTEIGDLVEGQSLVYLSPEALSDSRKVSAASDVFSLGAIAFHLFACRPPAGNPTELARILRDHKGLSLSAVVDGIGPKLEELVRWSTHPDVLTRIESVEDFLTLLADVEDELTSPDEDVVEDPLQAKRGDQLPGGWVVQRDLGQGATARALLVERDGKELVLKVALGESDNARLHEEAAALRTIRSEFIVALEDELTLGGRTTLVLQKAGDQTLASLLAKEGVPSLDLLARYGDDLLSAVASLERCGVSHRDIKPDNIGVRSLTKQPNQLVLFDFSLARAPLDNLHVGTEGYRDPFLPLRKPPRWDLAAERYSAAVTLYEMTLGSGVLPQWGSNKSDPALTDDQLVIDAEKFDPSVREGLVAFFGKALDRQPDRRFPHADEMRWAWQEVFRSADERRIQTPAGQQVVLGIEVADATLETPVSALGVSTRARNALERANVILVQDLLKFPLGDIHLMRGVGNRTRREILELLAQLRTRFPTIEPSRPPEPTLDPSAGPLSLAGLYQRVVGVRHPQRQVEWGIRAALLGVDRPTGQAAEVWPSQTEVAESLGVSRTRVFQVLAADRARWSKDPQVTALRQTLCEKLRHLGGVATIAELIEVVLLWSLPPDALDPLQPPRMASTVARAAVETEDLLADRRFQIRRVCGHTLVACTRELAVYAQKLGEVADRLAEADPLVSPLRALHELFQVPQPDLPGDCLPIGNERLFKLAAATSRRAAVSSRQEIYPRQLPAPRALRLALGALSGLGFSEAEAQLTIQQIRERVHSRYPAAEPLPERPALDALLDEVGLGVRWDEGAGCYRRRALETTYTSGSSLPQRRSTAQATRGTVTTPEVAEARGFEERLRYAYRDGGFLVLTVRPSRLRFAEAELLRRFELQRVSFDELLLPALRAEAQQLDIDWKLVEQADGQNPASRDWHNLLQLVGRVAPRILGELLQRDQHLLLVNPGLIARYDLMRLVETLRDRVGHDVPCPGLWLLVAADGQHELPMLDQAEIPLITAGQRARISEPWIDNLHRGRPDAVAAAEEA